MLPLKWKQMELSNNDFNYEITNDRGFSNYSKLIGHIRLDCTEGYDTLGQVRRDFNPF